MILISAVQNIAQINQVKTNIWDLIYSAFLGSLNLVFIVITVALLIVSIYYGFLMVVGLISSKKTYEDCPPKRKFLVFIPSHNEENVISGILKNLKEDIDYPKDLIDVYVIADNCNDKTASLSKLAGFKVIEHFSKPGEAKGKPYGIKYALDFLGEKVHQYDLVAFFDADNIVKENFFKEMNSQFESDPSIAVSQSYLDCKNIDDTFVSLGYAVGYYYTNRFLQNAKYKLKLTPAVGGTGFVVKETALDEVGWTVNSLTEDFEFQVQCVIKGYRTVWNHYTAIYDEKPTKAKQSFIQRTRWARGHWTVKRKYFRTLLKSFIKIKDHKIKFDFKAMDTAIYTLMPLVIGITPFMLLARFILDINSIPMISIVTLVFLLGTTLLMYYAVAKDTDQKIKSNVLKVILSTMWFSVTFVVIYLWGMITHKRQVWVRTEHKNTNTLSDVKVDKL